MNRKRILAIGKLVVLFGTPVALLLGLFSGGVYCGVTHREGITRFERNWLGLDVEVPGEPASGTAAASSGSPTPSEPSQANPPAPSPSSPQPVATTSGPGPTTTPAPTTTPPTTITPPTTTPTAAIPAPLPPVETRVDPLDDADRVRLQSPVVVRVKVLADPTFVDEHADWIAQVQRTVSRASHVFEEQFGIRLELWAVARWPVATEGMSAAGLLYDLQGRPREGVDVVLGFTSREHDGTSLEVGPVGPDDPHNGAYGLIYAAPGQREPHLRTLLHELSRLLGAEPITDPQSAAWKAGSFMSYAPVADDQVPWIDADNRRRVLAGKDRPFAPAPARP